MIHCLFTGAFDPIQQNQAKINYKTYPQLLEYRKIHLIYILLYSILISLSTIIL